MPPPRRRTRRRPQGGKGGSRRGSGGAAARRAAARRQKRRNDALRADIRDQARANQNRGSGADIRTGGTSTGRESGIMANQTKDRIKSLEQSVGSLDRRIENALKAGNLDLVKDLRSRQNVFTTRLGDERAIQAGGVMRTGDGRIIRTSDGRPVFTNKGLGIFQDTKDRDFLDPTRKLQNENPEEFAKMYPITNRLNRGLPGVALAKQALGIEDKPIAYTDDDMPGVRYPLDKDFGAGEGEPIAIDDFDKALDVAPPGVPLADQIIIPKVKPEPPIDKTDVTSKSEIQPNKEVLPYVPPFIDAEKVNPKLNEVIGTDNLPINLYNQNMAEFLADEERNLALKQPAITGLKDENIIMPGTQVSGENFANQVAENNAQLKQNVIANPELNNQQKEMILNEIDSRTGFQPITDQTSLLPTSNADQVIFDQYITDALNRMGQPQVVPQNFDVVDPSIVDPAASADALATLNSLNESNAERSLFERLFDSNPDEPGTQFFNLNPNR